MMRPAAAVLALLLSGCLATGPATDAEPPSPPAVTSLDVDLHEYLLNITMPEGQPTMLVQLNVTKDMWVRPIEGAACSIDGVCKTWLEDLPTWPASAPFWTLCPWVRSVGLPDGWVYRAFAFWENTSVLRPAARAWADRAWTDADGGHCATGVTRNLPYGTIASELPRNGRLVLLLAAVPAASSPVSADEGTWVNPSFHFMVGVARKRCQTESGWFCPPAAQQEAVPLLRGGVPVATMRDVGQTCVDCGFIIRDNRTPSGAPVLGSVTIGRTGIVGPGVSVARVLAFANAGPASPTGGRATLEMKLEEGARRAEATCENTGTQMVLALLAGHTTHPRFSATLDGVGPWEYRVWMLEMPLDADSIGRFFAPAAIIAQSGVQASLVGEYLLPPGLEGACG